MANPRVYELSSLTGGVDGALDSLNTTSVPDTTHANVDTGSIVYTYVFNSGSSAAENSPFVIAPDTGTGRWILSTAISKYDTGNNLLTNSGFISCSNATLENVPGSSNLVTTWGSGSPDYNTFTSTGVDIDSAINTGDGNSYGLSTFAAILTEDRVYRLVVEATLTSGEAPDIIVGTSLVVAQGLDETLANGTNTFIFRAGADASTLWVKNTLITNWSADFTLYAVTPGFVTGAAGPDGWIMTSGFNSYQFYCSDETMTGMFGIHTVKAKDAQEVLWTPITAQQQSTELLRKYAGRTVALGAFAKDTNADNTRLVIYDGSFHYSDFHSGSGNEEWLEFSYDVPTDPTYFIAGFTFDGDTADEAYVTDPMLKFGSVIGEGNYSQPQGEWVVPEQVISVVSNDTPAAADDKILEIDVLTSGKISAAKELDVTVRVSNSAITTAEGISIKKSSAATDPVLYCNPIVNDIQQTANGQIECDLNGDIYQLVTEAGATLSGLYIDINKVRVS